MKYLLKILVFLFTVNLYAQVDYSSSWKDFYSYNNVVDFTKVSNVIYAITENSVFTYNTDSGAIEKLSSVNGLSGNQTSSIYFDEELQLLVVGYEDGLLEIIDQEGEVKRVVDISLSEISTKKQINSIYGFDNKLYLSLGFGIVVYDLIDLEFGDTYFIGENSTDVYVNDLIILEGDIFAATEEGIYIASITANLANSNNWVNFFSGEFSRIIGFENEVIAVQGNNLFKILNNSDLELKVTLPSSIVSTSSYGDEFSVITSKQAFLYDSNFDLKLKTNSTSGNLTSIETDGDKFYLGSEEKGILNSTFLSPNDFEEIHPDGPSSNKLFSITVKEGEIWSVYGGFNTGYAPLGRKRGVSHLYEGKWIEVLRDGFTGVNGARDLVHVTIDPLDSRKVYISSWSGKTGEVDSNDAGGVLVLEDDEFSEFWNTVNTNTGSNKGLTNLSILGSGYISTRINGSSFDSLGNLWVINSSVNDGSGALKKKTVNDVWTGVIIGKDETEFNVLKIDTFANIWIGSREEGMFVYNETENKSVNLFGVSMGIPDNHVRAIGIGVDNNIWIGTAVGVVRFSDVDNVFSGSFQYPEAVIIDGADGASRLLDRIKINDIKIDGAGNVWFATATGGVLQTNSTGKLILNEFNVDNSPLPTNNVLSIGIDDVSGTVYFGTFDGIVAYDAGIVGYGEVLSGVYAYPNPSLKNNNEIKIVGKNSNLPEGTNMKILDTGGNLVFESNASENQSSFGGEFVWNKRNLAGRKVTSGVYIVLLFNTEGQQTSSTKIAIIN